jgi:hypothetical protein
MPSIINSDDGVVSGTSGLKTTGGNDGLLNIQTNGSTAMSVNASQQVTFNNGANLPNTFGFKNRLINGGMVIDQRNAGTSVTPSSSAYTLDRWKIITSPGSKFSFQQSSTVPTGFQNSILCTSLSAYSAAAGDVFRFAQFVEGFNAADLGFGTAGASSVTISFWVRSSLTGTFAVSLINDNADRSYVATYTISAANTWEYKTVTIAGDTTGTWLKTNGAGVGLVFDLGSGTSSNTTANAWQAGNFTRTSACVSLVGNSSATFYLTGVQLEKGSAATSFDLRSYSAEMLMCQRYYEKSYADSVKPGTGASVTQYFRNYNASTTLLIVTTPYKVQKRTTPTAQCYDGSGNAGKIGVNDNISDPDNQAALVFALGVSAIMVQSNSGASINGMRYLYTAEAEL